MSADFARTRQLGQKFSNLPTKNSSLFRSDLHSNLGFRDLYKLAIILKMNSQKLYKELEDKLTQLWFHLEKDGGISLKETSEKMSHTNFVIRSHNIKIVGIFIIENLILLDEPIQITLGGCTWNQDHVDIGSLRIYQSYIEEREHMVKTHLTWPDGEIINTGRSKTEIWDYINNREKLKVANKKHLERSITF